jgi:cytochrome c peroxidase
MRKLRLHLAQREQQGERHSGIHQVNRTRPSISRLTSLWLTFFVIALPFTAELQAAEKGQTRQQLSKALKKAIVQHSDGKGLKAFKLPYSHQFKKIPQDPNNKITAAKVVLGKLLFHETELGLNPQDEDFNGTYSCASCHHAAAGFKAGIPQGLGEGGVGFGNNGEGRRIANSHTPGSTFTADFQPIASPTILNSAYQNVMLWNGSFGNSAGGINDTVDTDAVQQAGPPGVAANAFRLSGLETQAIAGTKVHRLKMAGSILESHPRYKRLFRKAFPRGVEGIPANSEVDETWLGAALAIAAYERTVLANKAPFQRWLYGNHNAMSRKELRGGILFFGKAQCVECHTGPALSSKPHAGEDSVFFNIGFEHLDSSDPLVHGTIDTDTRRGRGGFTGRLNDRYKFKIPQLYNLKNTNILGHGASFTSVRDVIVYKNNAVPQSGETMNLATEFRKLNLSETEIDDLTAFVENALYDKRLFRYVPRQLPSGSCFPVADFTSSIDLGCL